MISDIAQIKNATAIQAFVEKCGDKYATSPETCLANGAFILSEYKQGATSISFIKNTAYYGAALKLMNDNTSEVRAASQGVIRESMDKISQSTGDIMETSNALSEIADSVESAVGQIGGQIDLFKV